MAAGIIQKLKEFGEHRRRQMAAAAPLREELFRQVLIVAAVALAAQGILLRLAGIGWARAVLAAWCS